MSSLYKPETNAPGTGNASSTPERRNDVMVGTIRELGEAVARAKHAQEVFSSYAPEMVDAIYKAVCKAVNKAWMVRIGMDDTGAGPQVFPVSEREPDFRHYNYAGATHLLVGVTPASNPTLTAACKVLEAIKSRKALILSPYPQISQRVADVIDVAYHAAVEAGAPEGFLCCADLPGVNLSQAFVCSSKILAQPAYGSYVQAAARKEDEAVTLLALCPLQ